MLVVFIQIGIFLSAIFVDTEKLDWSMSRALSQMTGRLCNAYIPPYIRVVFFRAFGALYGVTFDDLPPDSDINGFRSFN